MRGERIEGILHRITFENNGGSGCAEIIGSKGMDHISFKQAVLAPKGRIRLYEDESRIEKPGVRVVELSDAMIASGRLIEAA